MSSGSRDRGGIGPTTRIGAVIGDPVDHSRSPALHNAAFAALDINAVFVALRVASRDLGAAIATLRGAKAIGVSVTVPHKEAVIEHCDELAASARAVGAVNCIELSGRSVVGHNTDAKGFATALREQHPGPMTNWRPLILGGGGAARAVAVGLEQAGAEEAVVVARTPDKVAWRDAKPWTARSLEELLPARNLIVDCTSTALSADAERGLPAAIDLAACPSGTVVCSLVYHREPALLREARRLGLGAVDGRGMLIHQAVAALEIWLGVAPAPAVLASAWPDD